MDVLRACHPWHLGSGIPCRNDEALSELTASGEEQTASVAIQGRIRRSAGGECTDGQDISGGRANSDGHSDRPYH